jgi:hypothetical protein
MDPCSIAAKLKHQCTPRIPSKRAKHQTAVGSVRFWDFENGYFLTYPYVPVRLRDRWENPGPISEK